MQQTIVNDDTLEAKTPMGYPIADAFSRIPLIREAVNYRLDLSTLQSRKLYEAKVVPTFSEARKNEYLNQLIRYHQMKE